MWIGGVGARLAFAIAAGNGAGPAIARFSIAHHITGSAAWIAALVMMALADVLTRLAVIYLRGRLARRRPGSPRRRPHPGRRPRLTLHPPAAASCPDDGTAGRGTAVPGHRRPASAAGRTGSRSQIVPQPSPLRSSANAYADGLQNAPRVVPGSSRGGPKDLLHIQGWETNG